MWRTSPASFEKYEESLTEIFKEQMKTIPEKFMKNVENLKQSSRRIWRKFKTVWDRGV